MSGPDVYPLAWPEGWPRTKQPQSSRFQTTLAQAIKNVEGEVARLGGKGLILSSNMAGLSRAQPKDKGVAAYFTLDGESVCIPCDAWTAVEDNVQAIAKTLEAMRGIERWGAKELLKAAFRGFKALPHDPGARPWRAVFDFTAEQPVSKEAITARYRHLASRRHPDAGGSDEAMAELNAARVAALKEVSG